MHIQNNDLCDFDPIQAVHIGSLDKIVELHKKLQAVKSPLGTRESPARSCLDLYVQNNNIEDGNNLI